MEYFDPNEEMWVEKQGDDIPVVMRSGFDSFADFQVEKLGDNFVTWRRKALSEGGTLSSFDKGRN